MRQATGAEHVLTISNSLRLKIHERSVRNGLVSTEPYVDEAMNNGITPLLIACQKGQVEALSALNSAKVHGDKVRNDTLSYLVQLAMP